MKDSVESHFVNRNSHRPLESIWSWFGRCVLYSRCDMPPFPPSVIVVFRGVELWNLESCGISLPEMSISNHLMYSFYELPIFVFWVKRTTKLGSRKKGTRDKSSKFKNCIYSESTSLKRRVHHANLWIFSLCYPFLRRMTWPNLIEGLSSSPINHL